MRTWNEASASMKPANQELEIKGDVSRGRTTRFSKGSRSFSHVIKSNKACHLGVRILPFNIEIIRNNPSLLFIVMIYAALCLRLLIDP